METRGAATTQNRVVHIAIEFLPVLAIASCTPQPPTITPRPHMPPARPATTVPASASLSPTPTPPVTLPPWPSIAPPGYLLAATHWTQAGQLWLLLRPLALDGSRSLRVCSLATDPKAARSLRRVQCRDLPDTVPRFTVPEVGFALDDEPIVVGPDPNWQVRRVGYAAESGAPVPIRGMMGQERRNGLTVEKVAFGRYEVMQVAEGKVKMHAFLNVPVVEAWDDQPFDPVVVGDQVGWFKHTNTEAGWGWFFSRLTAKGLTPHLVGGEYPLRCARCDQGLYPVLELGGVCCSYFAFFRDGSWSDPVHTETGIAGAGPRLRTQNCRENLATLVLAEYGLTERDGFVVELNRCTVRECEASTVTWKAPKPSSLLFAAHLVDDAGSEKIALAWHDAEGAFAWKLSPIEALARAEARVVRLPHRVAPDNHSVSDEHILVHDGVVLVVFGDDALRILRLDVDGNVGSVDVEGQTMQSSRTP